MMGLATGFARRWVQGEKKLKEERVNALCPMCWNLGWAIDCNNIGDTRLHLELIGCPYPACTAQQVEIERLVFKGPVFDEVSKHPKTGVIMSVGRWTR